MDDKIPYNYQAISCDALVDTGAQMVVLGIDIIHSMGIEKKYLIPVGMKIKQPIWGDYVYWVEY